MVQWPSQHRKGTLILALCLGMALISGAGLADDEEDPITPTAPFTAPIALGDVSVEAVDVAGDSVDVWSAVEPDVTVYLTTNDPALTSSEKLVVDSQSVSTVCIMAAF